MLWLVLKTQKIQFQSHDASFLGSSPEVLKVATGLRLGTSGGRCLLENFGDFLLFIYHYYYYVSARYRHQLVRSVSQQRHTFTIQIKMNNVKTIVLTT